MNRKSEIEKLYFFIMRMNCIICAEYLHFDRQKAHSSLAVQAFKHHVGL